MADHCYVKCRYTECSVLFIIMLNVVILSVVAQYFCLSLITAINKYITMKRSSLYQSVRNAWCQLRVQEKAGKLGLGKIKGRGISLQTSFKYSSLCLYGRRLRS
jgi:hypothetical protein